MNTPRTIVAMFTVIAVLLGPTTNSARGEWHEVAKVLASDGEAGATFGQSVSISGDLAIVGADDFRASAAYAFRFDGTTWIEEAKIQAADTEPSDAFGHSVSLDGEVAIVGAPIDDDLGDQSGAAYIVRRVGGIWIEEAKLLPSDGRSDDHFGESVGVRGNVAIVGSINSDSAYIFRFNGSQWLEESRLVPSDPSNSDFGRSVAIDDDLAIVAAEGDDMNRGAAYIFRFNGSTWTEEVKLTASDGMMSDSFGRSVALSGEVAVVGASGVGDPSLGVGAAYIFRYDGLNWGQEIKLEDPDGAIGDRFGEAVAVSGDLALVGAFLDDDSGSDSGSAFVYRFDSLTWNPETKLLASDGAAGDIFGLSVATDGNRVLIGALGDQDLGLNSGSAYIFGLGIATIPTVSEWGLIFMGLLLLTGLTLVVRRRYCDIAVA